jgi:16S rRNA (cytosine967-C5)-methyltransferase
VTRPPQQDSRTAAAQSLVATLDRQKGFQDNALDRAQLDDRDRAFARHLVFGVLRWLNALEWLAGQLLQRPLKPRDRDVGYLILMGIFQLWKGGTAPHAAVNETAGAARKLGKPWAAGLVNAVLRNFQRQQPTLLEELQNRPERHAHPDWLLQQLQRDWPEAWLSVVEQNNQQPPLWIRINTRRCRRGDYLEKLEQAGLKAQTLPELTAAVRIEDPLPVTRLPGFEEGLFSVQDAAAQWAADYLDARPGHRVLDACAAPGGKTCHLLEHTQDIELLALDHDASRTALIRENLERLGLEAQVLEADATDPAAWWDGRPFDRILLDAPCSATGVIRRHPDIKWLRDPLQVEAAAIQQATLLDALWPLLGTGGMLVYATCSVLKRENSRQIIEFLDRHADAEPVSLGPATSLREPGRQILTGERNMDGFYYACLRKPA